LDTGLFKLDYTSSNRWKEKERPAQPSLAS
jgi:hypothetical protein